MPSTTTERSPPPKSIATQHRLGGLLSRRPRWGLTLRGYLAAASLILLLAVGWFFSIYPFFALSKPVETDVLVVEGWLNDRNIALAAEIYRAGGYSQVYSTGGPVQGMGGYVNDYSTAAHIGATRLLAAGVPREHLKSVPSRVRARDRTYHGALALREWFREHDLSVRSLNVVTADVHARRTRLLYQLAFGDEVQVGVIAIPSNDYDARRWWKYSDGVRDLLGECIAYTYAKFFFYPDE